MKKTLLTILFLLSPLSWSSAAPTCPPPDQCLASSGSPCACEDPEPEPQPCVPDPKGRWFCLDPISET
ncbi:hypothetical protein [Deinococcus cellulosilyticus]|uniref:Secreted protein n=1 Tax=Deinococcus cellulosilyticus (strain DSM 18568 / NBRC 106333 / KACC 11606 / 5516J-15) TaxID=1223518 RepID=A0A511MX87_DEIC1|nr:hypothetical protein [Deinococcus cellulosilyticus]GEM45199.1 hypothetical protein DC3_08340 [Deinococcus cellulosilyticus NBRC 106333 = KACC 11606]